MKHIKLYPNKLAGTDWRILGELDLVIAEEADSVVSIRLMDILNPLNLPADFCNKILKFAQDAVSRVIMSSEAAMEAGHIHLVVFAPRRGELIGKTWGFFRIEKLRGTAEGKYPPDRAVEFYLYPEG